MHGTGGIQAHRASQEDRRSINNPDVDVAQGVFVYPKTIQDHRLRDGDVVKAHISTSEGKSMTLGEVGDVFNPETFGVPRGARRDAKKGFSIHAIIEGSFWMFSHGNERNKLICHSPYLSVLGALACACFHQDRFALSTSFLLLVVRPGATSSVLAPNCVLAKGRAEGAPRGPEVGGHPSRKSHRAGRRGRDLPQRLRHDRFRENVSFCHFGRR